MGLNLTNQYISSSFQGLVQISGSELTDGTGSLISSLDILVSQAGTAGYASSAGQAGTAGYASTAGVATSASWADQAGTAGYASTAGFTTSASYATRADKLDVTLGGTADPFKILYASTGDSQTVYGDSQLTYNPGTNTIAGGATFAGTASYALTASYAENVPTIDTGSLMETGSVSLNVLTFTKADGSTFDLTVDTGSAATINTGSLLTTASIADATITFTKGDASTFDITVNNVVNATSASFADQAGTSGYAVNALSSSYALTASYLEGAVDAFPYTGSAAITGSLHVTGSQTGILADNEEYKIFTKQASNSTSPNIFIGAQDPSMNGLNTPTGINNIVIGTGEWTSDIKGLGASAGDSNTVIGGWGGVIYNGQYNTVIGAGIQEIAYSGDVSADSGVQYNTIIGATSAQIEKGTSNIIAGGNLGKIYSGSEATPNYNVVIGGNANTITGTDNASIVGGGTNAIVNGDGSIILGGNSHEITYAAGALGRSAILAGNNATVTHLRSVTIGGNGLASTQDDEVVVPNLTISGSGKVLTFADGTTQSTAAVVVDAFPYTGSAAILGNVDVTISGSNDAYLITSGSFTGSAVDNINNVTGSIQVKHIAYATQAEYDAITPDDNTLYFISQSATVGVTIAEGTTGSLDCSLGTTFIVSTSYTSPSGSIMIEATNMEAGTTYYIQTPDSNPAYQNVYFGSGFGLGAFSLLDDCRIMGHSFNGTTIDLIASNAF